MLPNTGELLEQRFWAKVNKNGPNGCWLWVGNKNVRGYGRITVQRKLCEAHRVSWELFKGKIPKGFVIDHLCRVHACVNPDHLRTITSGENVTAVGSLSLARTNKDKTHCVRGHEFTTATTGFYKLKRGDKIYTTRRCRTCCAWYERVKRRKLKMTGAQYDIVLGDDCMALFENGSLRVAATRLTFIDVLEACGIPCDLHEGDLEKYDSPEKFPTDLKLVVMDEMIGHDSPAS